MNIENNTKIEGGISRQKEEILSLREGAKPALEQLKNATKSISDFVHDFSIVIELGVSLEDYPEIEKARQALDGGGDVLSKASLCSSANEKLKVILKDNNHSLAEPEL